MYYGERVMLRRVDPVLDLEDRYRWMNDPEVLRYLGMLPRRLSRDEVRRYLESCAASTGEMVEFAIVALEGRHIGSCALRNFNLTAHTAEYSVLIGEPEYRGKGYGTEVTRLVAEVAFEQLNLNRIWLHVHTENIAGLRAYERAGFTREGLLRQHGYKDGKYYDVVVMGMLRSEYEARKGAV